MQSFKMITSSFILLKIAFSKNHVIWAQCDGSGTCTRQDPIWALISVPAAPLHIQIPDCGLGKQ